MVLGLSLGLAVTAARGEQPKARSSGSAASRLSLLNKQYPNRQRFGMNLTGVIDYTFAWPLVDGFKISRPWMKKGTGEFAFDSHGNPLLKTGQSVESLTFREIDGHYPKGIYVATYEGSGNVQIPRFDVRRIIRSSPGRIEFEVVPGNGGLLIAVTRSDPKDPIRNIHVWMPGFEKAKCPFHPLFLKHLQPFGVIRFMDWQRTNNNPIKAWSQRPKPDDARYTTPGGVPLELMIELANDRMAHPWFCMPHLADDAYIREFASMVKERLDPSLKVYVEYSNEVWNFQFQQARYASDKGKALGLGSGFQAQLRYYSQRAVEVFKIWEKVFGGEKRVIRVMGSQAANPWVSEQVLGWKGAYAHVDALAIAPYFGNGFGSPKTQNRIAQMTLEELLGALEQEVKGQNLQWIQKQAQVARKYKVQLMAYEGGQHLVGVAGAENNKALTDLFIAANRHPQMGVLYKMHLTNWFKSGGGLYVIFSNVAKPSKWGAWGMLEYQDQPISKAPKYRAVHEFIKSNSVRK
jgi:hypothetical protein